MYLSKDYPVPSERMGLLWALSGVRELVIVEFGPEGTTRYLLESLKEFGKEAQASFYTTTMDEDVVVFGNYARLNRVLVEIDQRHHPEVIVVMDSSVAAVIGADLDGICHEIKPHIKAKLITIKGGGLKNDWTKGITAALQLLGDLANEKLPAEQCFNLIGCCADEYNHLAEAGEIAEMMIKHFAMKLNCNLSGNTSVATCKKLGQAAVNLVLRQEGLALAEDLKQRFNIPYVYGRPYGLAGTRAWLTKIEQATGLPADYSVDQATMTALKTVMEQALKSSPTKAIVLSGHDDSIRGLAGFFRDELNLEVLFLKSSWSANPDGFPFMEQSVYAQLRHHREVMVLADGLKIRNLPDTDRIQIAHPKIADIAEDQPGLMGWNGAVYLLGKLNH